MSNEERPRLAWNLSPQLYAWRLRSDGQGADDEVPQFLREGVNDAAAAGYGGVELSLSVLKERQRRLALGALLSEQGLELAAVFASVRTGAAHQELRSIVELATEGLALGCGTLNLVTVGNGQDRFAAASVARVPSALAQELSDRGVSVCWHPHGEDMVEGGGRLNEILHVTEGSSLSICLDVGWALRVHEDPATLLEMCAHRVGLVHFRDLRSGTWCQAVGEGDLNLKSILYGLQRLSYDGWLVVELKSDRKTVTTRSLRDNARLSREALLAETVVDEAD